MPVDHPLTFFGPYTEFAGTGKEIGLPLMRDQGNSAYMRDTGDPKTAEGGQIEWGYYEEKNPRLCHPRDLLEKHQARLSPSQRDLDMDQIIEPLERAMELTPILGELGYNESHSFNGLLQVTADGGPSMGESQKVRGLWYAVAIWVKDGPGMGKLIADWMTDGRTEIDHAKIDYARFYPHQMEESVHRGPLRRGGAEGLQSRGASARALCDWPQRSPLAVLRAREGTRRLFHGTRRLGTRPWLRGQRAPARKIRRPRSGSRKRVGQPPFLARLQRRASRHERGLRHRQPVALLDVRHRGARPCRADGMALRCQDRRRRQYRQGHLHAFPRRAREWCAPTSPSSAWPIVAGWSTAPTPGHATSATCSVSLRTKASMSP